MNHFLDPRTSIPTFPTSVTTPNGGMVYTELPLPERKQDSRGGTLSTVINRFFKNQIESRFRGLEGGRLSICSQDDVFESARAELFDLHSDQIDVAAVVNNDAFYRSVFLGGTIGAAESYMRGEWVADDLTDLIRLMIRNLGRFNVLESGWAWTKNAWNFMGHLKRKNTVEGSRQNIHDHYDLGNDFYQLFLDPTMNYSSGIFDTAEIGGETLASMTEASVRKMDRVCQRLQLTAADHVLEIGTGWGALSIHMASRYGCRVTTTTISEEQFRLAVARVNEAGLSDRVTVLLKDYRDLEGSYDKIVSIEMIEAVGHEYYDEYFAKCSSLLNDRGVMLLQSITMGENDYSYHIRHVDFIRKYVFPGGCLPCVSALTRSVGRVSNMRMLVQDDITPHYTKTLRFWRNQFLNKLDEVRGLGYSESFIRLWHFYLCYCEAAFAERRVHNIHLMFAKPGCTVDPAVDYSKGQLQPSTGQIASPHWG